MEAAVAQRMKKRCYLRAAVLRLRPSMNEVPLLRLTSYHVPSQEVRLDATVFLALVGCVPSASFFLTFDSFN